MLDCFWNYESRMQGGVVGIGGTYIRNLLYAVPFIVEHESVASWTDVDATMDNIISFKIFHLIFVMRP